MLLTVATNRDMNTDRDTNRDTDRETDRDTDRHRDRDTDRYRDRGRDMDMDTNRDMNRDTDTDTDTPTDRDTATKTDTDTAQGHGHGHGQGHGQVHIQRNIFTKSYACQNQINIIDFLVVEAGFGLGCPIFASFNYSLRSKKKRIQFLFASNLLRLANIRFKIFASICFDSLQNIRFKTNRIFASKYSLRFTLIRFKIFPSEQSECKKFTSQKGAK